MKKQNWNGMEFADGSGGGVAGAVAFLRAVAAQPNGRPPLGRNGPQRWSRERGFHDGDSPGTGASFGESLAEFTARMESASRRRRAERELAQRARLASRAETDALIARSEQKLEAALTPMGQLLAAARRENW